MNRRAVLAAVPLVALAGCIGVNGATDTDRDDTDRDDASETAAGSEASSEDDGAGAGDGTDADVTVSSTDLVEVEPATAPADPSVGFASETVHVEGTVVGTTGCHGVEVADAAVDDGGTFGVVVASTDEAEPDQLCTQSLTEIGYELDATFDGGRPDAVRIVHDDARGRETAAESDHE